MNKIEAFDRPTLEKMRAEIESALAPLTEKYGVTFDTGNIRYSDKQFNIKITGTAYISDEEKAEKDMEKFQAFAKIFQIPIDAYHKAYYDHTGKTAYRIVGVNPRARVNVLTIEDVITHKQYTCPREYIDFSNPFGGAK